jgi:hypothetical protein
MRELVVLVLALALAAPATLAQRRGGGSGGGIRGGGGVSGGWRGGGSGISGTPRYGGGFAGGGSYRSPGSRGGNWGYSRGYGYGGGRGGWYGYRGPRFYSSYYWPYSYYGLGFGLGYGYYGGYWPSYGYYDASWYPWDSGYYPGYYTYSQPASPPVVVIQQDAPAPARIIERRGVQRNSDEDSDTSLESVAPSRPYKPPIYKIAFTDHKMVSALAYWVKDGVLHYVTVDHAMKEAPLASIDRRFTEQINRDQGLSFRLPGDE